MKTTQKRPAARKKTVKPARKRSKTASEAVRAFKLVIALIITSICVSFAIITIHKNTPEKETKDETSYETSSQAAPSKKESEKPSVTQEQKKTEAPKEKPQERPVERSTGHPSPRPVVEPPAITVTATSATTDRKEAAGKIAFVIDDAGNNLFELEPFLRLPGPVTIAVLPGLPHSKEAARRIRAAGKEVILHQPMEALGGQNPGPGAIYSSMSEQEVRAVLEQNLKEVGPVAGMNNHQGSKITTDRRKMEIILSFCLENDIYFLDSRTTSDTVAVEAARRLGMEIAQRDTFLDNEPGREAMQRYLNSGLARAGRNGTSVMIGHTWSQALGPLLLEQYPQLTIQGYSIITVSDILKSK